VAAVGWVLVCVVTKRVAIHKPTLSRTQPEVSSAELASPEDTRGTPNTGPTAQWATNDLRTAHYKPPLRCDTTSVSRRSDCEQVCGGRIGSSAELACRATRRAPEGFLALLREGLIYDPPLNGDYCIGGHKSTNTQFDG